MSLTCEVLIRVRYAECDPQNIVFNSRYGEYVDLAVTEFYRQAMGGYEALMNKGFDVHVVNLNTDYYSPARFDDVLLLKVGVAKLGSSSFSFSVEMFQQANMKPVATASITYVMVDNVNYKKVLLPEFFRETLQGNQVLQRINLAGS